MNDFCSKNGESAWDKPLNLGFHVLWRDHEEPSEGAYLYSEAELQSLSLCDKGVRKKASSEGYRSDSLHGGEFRELHSFEVISSMQIHCCAFCLRLEL